MAERMTARIPIKVTAVQESAESGGDDRSILGRIPIKLSVQSADQLAALVEPELARQGLRDERAHIKPGKRGSLLIFLCSEGVPGCDGDQAARPGVIELEYRNANGRPLDDAELNERFQRKPLRARYARGECALLHEIKVKNGWTRRETLRVRAADSGAEAEFDIGD